MSTESQDARMLSATLWVSDEMLRSAQEMRSAVDRWMSATPEERARWALEMRAERAEQRRTAERVSFTLDALIKKLGWTADYAEHFVQSYCECEQGMDGWEYCQHARDEELSA